MRTLTLIAFFLLASRAFAQESTLPAPTSVVIMAQESNDRVRNAVVSNAIVVNWTTSPPTISIFVESVDTGRHIQTLSLSGERNGAFWIFRVPVQASVSSPFVEVILGSGNVFAVTIDEAGERQLVAVNQVAEVYFPFNANGDEYCVSLSKPIACMGSNCPPI